VAAPVALSAEELVYPEFTAKVAEGFKPLTTESDTPVLTAKVIESVNPLPPATVNPCDSP
jgi:hypothetical protein